MLKKTIFIFLKISGINFIYSLFSKHKVFIVGYHSIHDNNSFSKLDMEKYKHISISKEVFEKQIKLMNDNGHTFINFLDLENNLSEKIEKPTIIYFDDGFKDNLTVALPIMKKYNVKPVIFIVPKYVESGDGVYMSWDDVRSASDQGVEIGSHTYNHGVLTELSQQDIENELRSSKEKIEKEIKKNIISFSYPKGRYNNPVSKLVKESGYKYAITTKYGLNSFDYIKNNTFKLKKVAPRVYENIKDFYIRLYSLNLFR